MDGSSSESKNKRCVFEQEWIAFSNYDNRFRFSSQHNCVCGGGEAIGLFSVSPRIGFTFVVNA